MNNSAPFHIIHENSNSFWRHLEWCNQQCTVMWRRYFIFIFSNIQTGLDSRDGNVTRPHCPCHARTMQQTKIKCWTSNLKFPFYFPKMTPANSILKGKKKQNKTKTRISRFSDCAVLFDAKRQPRCLHLSLSSCSLLTLKGIFSDSNNIFLWHKSEDINKKKVISKISVHSKSSFTSYAWLCALVLLHRLMC